MPTASIDPVTGAPVVQYYDNRNGGLNQNGSFLLDVFVTFSRDGGASFSPGIQINDLPFDPDLAAGCNYECGQDLLGVWGTSANDVFGVCWSFTILHYDGLDWSDQSSATSQPLFGVG